MSLPAEPMGEAWFMGEERHQFHNLYGDLSSLPVDEIKRPLEEIVSGTSAFGHLKEWSDWYHYLLPALLSRSHERHVDYLLEYLISGFVTQHPKGLDDEPYAGYTELVLDTLGRCIMDEHCWNGEEIALGKMLWPNNRNPNKVWCWWNASGDFSASMFLCLKYLPSEAVKSWLPSVLRIAAPHWRAQVMVWLVGANDILKGQLSQPSEFPEGARPSVAWAWSHAITGNYGEEYTSKGMTPPSFLPRENCEAALELTTRFFTIETYDTWLSSMANFDYLTNELGEIPEAFTDLYVSDRSR